MSWVCFDVLYFVYRGLWGHLGEARRGWVFVVITFCVLCGRAVGCRCGFSVLFFLGVGWGSLRVLRGVVFGCFGVCDVVFVFVWVIYLGVSGCCGCCI